MLAPGSNIDRPRWTIRPLELHQIRLRVDDVVGLMPIARKKVLDAIELKANRGMDVLRRLALRVVPEGVRVPETHVGRILERPPTVGRGYEDEEPTTGREAAICFLHNVDRISQMLERIVRPQETHGAGFDRPGFIEICVDVAVDLIDALVAGGLTETTAQVDLAKPLEIAPPLDELIDVFIVEIEGLFLNRFVLLAVTRIRVVHMVDIQRAIDVLTRPVDVGPRKDVLIVQHRELFVVTADLVVEFPSPRAHVVGRKPDLTKRHRVGGKRDSLKVIFPIDYSVSILPAVPVPKFKKSPVGPKVDEIRINEIDVGGERRRHLLKRGRSELVVVVDLDQYLAPREMTGEALEVPDLTAVLVLGWNDSHIRQRHRGLFTSRCPVRDDNPLKVLEGLPFKARLKSGQVVKSVGRGKN